MKYTDIKVKYPQERVRALLSILAKKNTTLDQELYNQLEQLYTKNVKPEVREFIKELEDSSKK